MKLIKVLSLIPIYFLLVVFNNLQNLVIDKNFINVDFINIPTIAIFGVLALTILFSNKIKCKKMLTAGSIVSVGCLLLNGYLGDKEIYRYSLVFMMFMYNAWAFAKITSQRFEVAIFGSNAVVLLVGMLLGFVNMLNIFIYVVVAMQLVALGYILIKRDTLKSAEDLKFNGTSILIFGVMFLVFVCGGINRFVHTWDEYSHWAYDATVLNGFDKFSTCEEVVSSTRTYPPMLSLWHYLTSRIALFNEQHLYISLSLFVLICLMPAFVFIKKENKAFLPLMTMVLFFGAGLFGTIYTYQTLYADLAIASIFFCSFILYNYYRDNDEKAKNYMLFLNMAVMVLVKPTGIINAFVLFVIMALIDYLKWNDNKFNKKNFLKDILALWKKYYKLGLSVVAVFVIWFGYVKVCNMTIPMYYDSKVLPESLETGVKYKMHLNIITSMLLGVVKSFDASLVADYTFMQFIVLMVLVSMFALYLSNEKSVKKAFAKLLPYLIGGVLYCILTALAIFVTFTAYEASLLASFGRYVNNFNVSIFLLLMVYLCSDKFLKNKGARVVSLLILVYIICNIGMSSMTFYVSDVKTRAKTRDTSYELRDKIETIVENTEENSQVYVIDQKDEKGIMAMWYARYYGFPRRTNAYHQSIAWKIKTDDNDWDLKDWGMTAEKLSKDLIDWNFDYLYFYSATEEMYEKMEFMFEDYENCREYTLFKVENVDGNAMLVAVK